MRPEKKKSWRNALFAYAEGEKGRMAISVVLSVLSVAAGLVPFYCMYALLCCIVDGTATAGTALQWCLLSLGVYVLKILLFTLSTGVSPTTCWRACACASRTASSMRLLAAWRSAASVRSRP